MSCGDDRAEREVCVGVFAGVAGVETDEDGLCVDVDGVRVAVAGVGGLVAGDCAVAFFAIVLLSYPSCSQCDRSEVVCCVHMHIGMSEGNRLSNGKPSASSADH
jgi:hypothetical protein